MDEFSTDFCVWVVVSDLRFGVRCTREVGESNVIWSNAAGCSCFSAEFVAKGGERVDKSFCGFRN